jgi:hypothetical protein
MLKINFEFNASYTPERNGSIEQKFATPLGKTQANWNSSPSTKWLLEKLLA